LIDAVPGAAVVLDGDGRVVSFNRAAERVLGSDRGEIVGASLATLLGSEALGAALADVGERFPGVDLPSVVIEGMEISVCDRGGAWVTVEVAVSAISGVAGPGFVVFLDDVSGLRLAARGLQRFEAIVGSSGDAIMSVSLEGTIESWNAAAERLYGYSEAEMIGSSVGRLPAGGGLEDFAREAERLAQCQLVSVETRARHQDGSSFDVAVTLSPLRDEACEIVGVVAVVRDVTERNRAAERLEEANCRFVRAFEAASTGMALVAPDGRFLDVNPALCQLLDRDRDALLACTFAKITHPDDIDDSVQQLRRALAGEIDTYRQTKRYLLPSGGIVWGLMTFTITRDASGAVQHFITQIEDITGRVTAEGELDRCAAHIQAFSQRDPVTGLLNHRAFVDALDAQLSAIDVSGAPLTVLLVTLEDASTFSAIADGLVRAIRRDDLIARIGDGELAIMLPNLDQHSAGPVIQRFTDTLADRAGVRYCHVTARCAQSATALLQTSRDRLLRQAPRPSGPSSSMIAGLLELARRQLGMPVAILARIDAEDLVFESITGHHEGLTVKDGDTKALDQAICQRTLDGRIGATVSDLAAEPETRGLEIRQELDARAYSGVPVVLGSGELYGTLCVIDSGPRAGLGAAQVQLLTFIAKLAAEMIDQQAAQDAVRRVEAGDNGVRTLLTALEARDFYTGEHSKQVVAMAAAVARRLGLTAHGIHDVEQVALLHDIGKVGIPDAILQKQGPLSSTEWELMRQHPIVGGQILAGTPGLAHLAPAMRAEHERWDGTGYPDGLCGQLIPIASRITLACDALHAMTSDRPYRPKMTLQRAGDEIAAHAGSQFDPDVTQALLAELATTPEPLANLAAAAPGCPDDEHGPTPEASADWPSRDPKYQRLQTPRQAHAPP
jgi:PAS domain S-box-containing protein